ncbi:prefoldin subunit beta [Candidatus Altiarchaeota archaeon]
MEIPKQVQDKLAQFQNLQNQLQVLAVQKQQLMLQSADTDNALGQLGEMKEGKVYRMSGPLLIETSKKDAEKKLGEEKEVLETRSKILDKQEKSLGDKLKEMGTELQAMLGQPGTQGTTKAG